jgi:hypothetical protein
LLRLPLAPAFATAGLPPPSGPNDIPTANDLCLVTRGPQAAERAFVRARGSVLAVTLLGDAAVRHCYRGHMGGGGLPDRSGTHCITALAVNAGGTHAISAAGGVLRRWDLHTGGTTAEALHAHRAPVSALALDADGSVALTGAEDGSVCGWCADAASLRRQPHTALPARGARVLALGLSQSGLAASLAADGTLQAWAWAGGAGTLRRSDSGCAEVDKGGGEGGGEGAPLRAAALATSHGAGLALTVAAASCAVRVWQLSGGASGSGAGAGAAVGPSLACEYVGHAPQHAVAVAACEGFPLAASTSGGDIHVWALRDGTPVARLLGEGSPWTACALHGGALLTGAHAGVLGFFHVGGTAVAVEQAAAGAAAGEAAAGMAGADAARVSNDSAGVEGDEAEDAAAEALQVQTAAAAEPQPSSSPQPHLSLPPPPPLPPACRSWPQPQPYSPDADSDPASTPPQALRPIRCNSSSCSARAAPSV